jgi:hypothetical protein
MRLLRMIEVGKGASPHRPSVRFPWSLFGKMKCDVTALGVTLLGRGGHVVCKATKESA